MENLNLEDVSNVWQAVTFIASVAVVTGFGWLTMRTKRNADKDEEKVAPVLAAAQQAAELRPEVAALSQALAAESAARMEMREELDKVSSIANTKYPMALDHIGLVHYRFPEVGESLPIPRVLRDDMEN